MRSRLNRVFAVCIIVGLALIGRGLSTPHPVLLWSGIALSGGNTVLLFFSLFHSAFHNEHNNTTPLGDT